MDTVGGVKKEVAYDSVSTERGSCGSSIIIVIVISIVITRLVLACLVFGCLFVRLFDSLVLCIVCALKCDETVWCYVLFVS